MIFLEISWFYLILWLLQCLSADYWAIVKMLHNFFSRMFSRRTSPCQYLIFCHLFAGNMLRDPEPELWPSEQRAVQPVAPVSCWWPLSSSDGRQRRSEQRPRGDIVRRLRHCLNIRSVYGGRYVDLFRSVYALIRYVSESYLSSNWKTVRGTAPVRVDLVQVGSGTFRWGESGLILDQTAIDLIESVLNSRQIRYWYCSTFEGLNSWMHTA